MNMPQAKIFLLGAVLGTVFGATVLGSIAHVLLIGLAVAGVAAVVHRGRRLVLHGAENEKRLED
jgi:hypothetical protein